MMSMVLGSSNKPPALSRVALKGYAGEEVGYKAACRCAPGIGRLKELKECAHSENCYPHHLPELTLCVTFGGSNNNKESTLITDT